MSIRADFYIGIREPDFLGSLSTDGEPWNIACRVLIQVNKTMYQETVIEFLENMKTGIPEKWLWAWPDSKYTDYTYFFSNAYGKVFAWSKEEEMMFDPLKIMQGEDLNSARLSINPTFPKMGAPLNGQATAKAV